MSQGQQRKNTVSMYEVAIALEGGNIITTTAADVYIEKGRIRRNKVRKIRIDGIAPGAAMIPHLDPKQIQAVAVKYVGEFDLNAAAPEGDRDVPVQSATEAKEEAEAGKDEPGSGPQAEQTAPGEEAARGIISKPGRSGAMAAIGISFEEATRNVRESVVKLGDARIPIVGTGPGEWNLAQQEQAAPEYEEHIIQEAGEQPRKIRIEYRQPKKLNRAERRAQAKAGKGKGQR